MYFIINFINQQRHHEQYITKYFSLPHGSFPCSSPAPTPPPYLKKKPLLADTERGVVTGLGSPALKQERWRNPRKENVGFKFSLAWYGNTQHSGDKGRHDLCEFKTSLIDRKSSRPARGA